MVKPVRVLTALIALFLVLGAIPAFADDGETGTDETTETTDTESEPRINGKFLILFAEGFNANEDDLLALKELGFGFGDLFKLNVYSTVLGVSIEDLLDGATLDEETGEWDFAWGELKKSLTDGQLALLEEMPRNFGQFVSAAKRHQGRDAHQPDHVGRDGVKPDKGSKPEHANKGGGSET